MRTLPLVLLALAAGCSPPDALGVPAPQRMIRTASWPISSLAQRLAPPDLPVHCSLPEGEDPITWMPDRETIAAFQGAALIVFNGAGLEGWRAHVSLPESRIFDASTVIQANLIEREEIAHSHGVKGVHSHGGTDPHTFLDPTLLVEMVGALRDRLLEFSPGDADLIGARAETLLAEVRALDEALRALSVKLAGRRLLASHPAYDYLARSYGWDLSNLDLDPAAELGAGDLLVLAERTSATTLAILWEREPLPSTRERLARELELPSVLWEPAEAPDPTRPGDFIAVQRRNIDRLLALLD